MVAARFKISKNENCARKFGSIRVKMDINHVPMDMWDEDLKGRLEIKSLAKRCKIPGNFAAAPVT